MKLRNKETGEVVEADYISVARSGFDIKDKDGNTIAKDIRTLPLCYLSVRELTSEFEDYEPKEPIIKDEKIRKAVRAWAEMNDIRFVHMCSRARKENARIVGQNALGRTFTMEIDNEYEIRIRFKDYKECYTIAELCGEGE